MADARTDKQWCRDTCKTTFSINYGPDQSLPGTFGEKGDVRRCEHGRLWIFDHLGPGYRIDHWQPISRIWEPITYFRASRALANREATP